MDLTNNGIFIQLTEERLAQLIEDKVRTAIDSLAPQHANQDNEGIISKKEVLEMLKVSSTTLFNWKRDGILSPFKIGKKVYYQKEDIMRALQFKTTAA